MGGMEKVLTPVKRSTCGSRQYTQQILKINTVRQIQRGNMWQKGIQKMMEN